MGSILVFCGSFAAMLWFASRMACGVVVALAFAIQYGKLLQKISRHIFTQKAAYSSRGRVPGQIEELGRDKGLINVLTSRSSNILQQLSSLSIHSVVLQCLFFGRETPLRQTDIIDILIPVMFFFVRSSLSICTSTFVGKWHAMHKLGCLS